jgi:hypothetical protein
MINRKIFLICFFVFCLLIFFSLLCAWTLDEGHVSTITNLGAEVYMILRFPTHTLIPRFFVESGSNAIFISGLVVNAGFYALVTERLYTWIGKRRRARMKGKPILIFIILLSVGTARAQKASIHARLVDSSAATPSGYLYEVEIKNDSFPRYWVQDTAFIKAHYGYNGWAHFYIILSKKVNGTYISYEKFKRHPGDVFSPDSCFDHCCSCIFLQPGESVKMILPLLAPYNIEKGDYQMEVTIAAPPSECNSCEQIGEIYTDLYFRIL